MMEHVFSNLGTGVQQGANRGPRCPICMHAETPRNTLAGFAQMTAILSFCANKPTHLGGAHKL